MKLGHVQGNVVSTIKHPCFHGQRVLIVQPLNLLGEKDGPAVLACDSVSAGPGDVVLLQQNGISAQEILGTKKDPLHSVIVGIVDRVCR
ncbi:MAG: EutN/CcmL family microcompartment protein [Oligoflexia bacterium]|nr:EutN/CcmL family microcompartment protein [Oligoflexia bacterium]